MTQQFSAPQGYGAPQFQQPAPQQMPQQYGQPHQQLPTPTTVPQQYPQGDLQPMMYGQQPQAYAAPPAQFAPQQNGQTGGFFIQQDPHLQAQQPAQPQFQEQQNFYQQPAQPVDTSSFFGGAATISWDDKKGYQVGTFRGGQIVEKRIAPQTSMETGKVITWDDGSPRMQMVLTLQTSERTDPQDTGRRQMFLKGDAPRAAREAFQAVGANDLGIGGWYYQAWVSTAEAKNKNFNAKKVFKGVYAPPGSPDPMAGQQPYQAPARPAAPPQQPAPGPLAQMPQQAVANFAQAAQVGGMPQQSSAFAPEVAQMNQQNPVMQAYQAPPTQQNYQGQQMPYGAWMGDVSAQQNGQPPAAPGSDYNPFGPTSG